MLTFLNKMQQNTSVGSIDPKYKAKCELIVALSMTLCQTSSNSSKEKIIHLTGKSWNLNNKLHLLMGVSSSTKRGLWVSGRFSMYMPCINFTWSSILSVVQSSVLIGGRYFTVSGAGLTCKLPFLHARWVPVRTIETIGRRDWIAKCTKPCKGKSQSAFMRKQYAQCLKGTIVIREESFYLFLLCLS